MENRPLQHALEAQSRLGVAVFVVGQGRGVLGDEIRQGPPQLVEIGSAGAQHLGRRGIVEQGEQEMLDRHEFVTLLPRGLEGHVQRDFELFA